MVCTVGCGLHQACPGDTRYEVFAPLFDRVDIRIDLVYGGGETFSIVAHGNGAGPRYCPVGDTQRRFHCGAAGLTTEIVAGGKRDIELGPQPNQDWGLE